MVRATTYRQAGGDGLLTPPRPVVTGNAGSPRPTSWPAAVRTDPTPLLGLNQGVPGFSRSGHIIYTCRFRFFQGARLMGSWAERLPPPALKSE